METKLNTQSSERLETLSVSIRRASELVGISQSKLYELLAAGAIQSTKIGSRRLILYASLKRLVTPAVAA